MLTGFNCIDCELVMLPSNWILFHKILSKTSQYKWELHTKDDCCKAIKQSA